MSPQRYLTIGAVALIAVTFGLAASSGWPRWTTRLTGQICVERPENNGVLNIRPSDVRIQGGPTLTLVGGEAACGYVEGGGKYTVWAQSRDPYDPSVRARAAWKSTNLQVEVKEGGRVELVVCAIGAKAAYQNWEVRAAEKACE